MALLGGRGGGSKFQLGGLEKLILFAVLGFIAYTMLPEITNWAASMVSEVTNTLHRLALPIAFGAAFVGLLVLLSPLHNHRSHGWKLVQSAAGLAAGAGIIVPALTWLNINTPTLVVGAMNMLANVGHGIGL